ncbi:MAG TPA: hypothetical protein VMV94_03425 [Phycisphaerae bacterium]|nr:hypothetical protein [Phycisphaerae bacterium]
MRRHKKIQKVVLALSIALAGGTVLGDGCINTLASIPICGTVLTFCTPQDQLNLFYPMLETPNFQWDPSCTVPYGCDGSDLYNPVIQGSGTPGGQSSPQPSQNQSGGQGG